ncbi:flagellar M-ring protein [Alicyclobacillus cellulosilyticus]|uniref:Flagellar M-ring protein n=1 Tax=Alicyclobacillus cellulosilyticus TaxID=1003997 RepID=A0A917K0I8_9BACL|nr:flagellar basal-body MS-ring/collar protein FliF [Alicyclobacillus cellulosilyticus]GGI94800.1 flagellar M-ring protein [Alicyclobacillus cellulosilyticus]
MNETIRNLWARAQALWGRLAPAQKRNLIIATGAGIACLAAVLWVVLRPHYVTIMSGLDDKSLGEVQQALEQMKIPNQIVGTSIEVPASEADTARVQLAMQGLPKTGYYGYNIPNSFGMTDAQFNIAVLDALQQSLSQTIESIDGVESAQVHIVLPQEQLFVSQPQDTAKASVFVQLGPGVQLTPAQVYGIQQLVAHSVKGLSAGDVTVVDQNGVVLQGTAGTSANDVSGVTELQVRQQLEQSLTSQLTAGLDQIVGPGNAVVVVHANLTFDKVESKSHTVAPVPGSDTGVLTSTQQIRRSTVGSAQSPGGIAGQATSNPGASTYAGTANAGNNVTSTDNEVTNQYDNNYTDTTTVRDPIQLRGYSVGVLINSNGTGVNPQVLRQIRSFVTSAVGAATGQGAVNSVSVVAVPFRANAAATSVVSGGFPWWLLAVLGLAAGAGGIAYGVFRSRRRQAVPLEDQVLTAAEASLEPAQLSEEERLREQLARLAQERPAEFANLLRTWLMED